MKILPVIFYRPQNTQRADFNKNQYDSYLNRVPIQDVVSFSAKAPMSGKEFARKYGKFMTCLYTGDPMLPSNELSKMKKRGFFKGPIKEVIHKTKPYSKMFIEPNSTEQEVYRRIERAAQEEPNITLTELFQSWYKGTRSQFRREQKPYFDEIKTLGAQLPPEYTERFYKFMEATDRKLYDEPVLQKFSLKEFKYKIEKTLEKTTDLNLKNRVSNLLNILSHESFANDKANLSPEMIKKIFDFKNIKVPYKKSQYYDKYLKGYETDKPMVQIKILENMKTLFGLKGYKKLERLCDDSINKILGKPVRVPFSNKSFLYDLDNKVLKDLPDQRLKAKILTTAKMLPSSAQSADALIFKLHDAYADLIGDRLFNPALFSIEHLHPASKGGADDMINCALAKRWINTMRGNEDLDKFIIGFDIKNQYKYAENLVKLNHKKKVMPSDAIGQLETIEREGHIDLSKYKAKIKDYEDPILAIKRKYAKKN